MRNPDFSPLYRSAIGFDRLFNLLEAGQSQGNGGYPRITLSWLTKTSIALRLPWPVLPKANWRSPRTTMC
ncbi:Small heat shock protein IbpA [Dickeya solani]|nr:Small heat shock protein IbpA [Dickeya solani]